MECNREIGIATAKLAAIALFLYHDLIAVISSSGDRHLYCSFLLLSSSCNRDSSPANSAGELQILQNKGSSILSVCQVGEGKTAIVLDQLQAENLMLVGCTSLCPSQ